MKVSFKKRAGISLLILSFAFPALAETAQEKAAAAQAAQQRANEERAAQEAAQQRAAQERAEQQRQQAAAQAAAQQRAQEQAAANQRAEQQRQQQAAAQAAKDKAAAEAKQQQTRKPADDQAAKDKANQAAKDKAAKDQAAKDQAAKDKAAKDQAAKDQAAKDKAAKDQAAKDQAAKDKAAKDQAAKDQAAKDKAAKDQAAKDKAAKDKTASNKAKQQKLTQQKSQLGAVKAISQNPEQIKAQAAQTTALKAQNQAKLKSLDAKKTPTALATKKAPPALRSGVSFGVDPKAKPVSPPANARPPVQLGQKGVPSYKANPKILTRINTGVTNRNGFQSRFVGNGPVGSRVSIYQTTYSTTTYNTTIINRGRDFNGYYSGNGGFSYRNYYSPWWNRGFYGGYYYPVVPCYGAEFQVNFWNPTIFWLYANTYEPDYYSGFYGDYWYYRAPRDPFLYAGDYYPSQVLMDWATEISAYSYDMHWAYRQALTNLTEDLSENISEQMQSSFQFNSNDIIVNHYQMITDGIYEVDGFIDDSWLHVPFKATININDPSDQGTNLVFVPLSQDPSQADPTQSANLDAINNLMNGYAPGSALTAYVEPEPTDLN